VIVSLRLRLQHRLHPLHVWSRWGEYKKGNVAYRICFFFYEKAIWQPFLRKLLKGGKRGCG